MRFLRQAFIQVFTLPIIVCVLSCGHSSLRADCAHCRDNSYYFYGNGDGCYDCCGETCVAGQAYTQSSICNLRTGLLVGGPLVAALIAVLILTSDSHAHH